MKGSEGGVSGSMGHEVAVWLCGGVGGRAGLGGRGGCEENLKTMGNFVAG